MNIRKKMTGVALLVVLLAIILYAITVPHTPLIQQTTPGQQQHPPTSNEKQQVIDQFSENHDASVSARNAYKDASTTVTGPAREDVVSGQNQPTQPQLSNAQKLKILEQLGGNH